MNQTLKKFLKYALNILLILGITVLTLHLLFKDNEPKQIFNQIKEADCRWLGIAGLLMHTEDRHEYDPGASGLAFCFLGIYRERTSLVDGKLGFQFI